LKFDHVLELEAEIHLLSLLENSKNFLHVLHGCSTTCIGHNISLFPLALEEGTTMRPLLQFMSFDLHFLKTNWH